jgi:hypothetical protein
LGLNQQPETGNLVINPYFAAFNREMEKINFLEDKKKYLIILIISFIGASLAGNFTDKMVRAWIEKVYPVFTGKPMVYDITEVDEKGIPFLIEGTIGKQRNPMTVCNRALSYHDKFIQGDSSQLILFLNCADWLAEDLIRQNDFAVLKYNYNWSIYNMVAPWRSGLANGVSLQVFIKAHAATQNEKYLEVAKLILNSFYVEVSEGGVAYKSGDKGWWFEEFADEGGYVSRVLNGHMFAVLGIHDYYNYTRDPAASYLFEKGLMALKNNLPKYDKGEGHSYYDLRGTPANIKYHYIHIDLLDQLFTISGDKVYKFYGDKWKTYNPPTLLTRLIQHPLKRIDVAIWLVNFAIAIVIVWISFYLFSKRTNMR